MSINCGAVFKILEDFAPAFLAEEWDNVGLQLGDARAPVSRAIICLDVDQQVCREAEEYGAQLIISHHPVIFKGLKNINLGQPGGALLGRLLGAGITVFSAHTNLDSAVGGVNHVLAQKLGLDEIQVLQPGRPEEFVKMAVFLPVTHEEVVRKAVSSAGAGWIGNYSECTFQVRGTGTFRPLEGANPYLGKRGELERVEEIRLETIMPAGIAHRVVAAMIEAHPYEEVAYDIYPLANNIEARTGLGRVGRLKEPIPFNAFVKRVKKALGLNSLRLGGGEPDRKISRVAVCGGSGSELWRRAMAAGADILVTGDVGYHVARDMKSAGFCFVDAGHFGTERIILPVLKDYLTERCREEGLPVEFLISEREHDPFIYYP